jgi:HK97 family phage prohead protease
VPYYITDKSESCPAWSVIKDGGEVLACHDTKESAIAQAIAVSLAEDTEFVGERAAVQELKIGDWVTWNIRNPKVLAQVVMIEGELAGLEVYELEDEVYHSTNRLMIMNVFKLQRIQMPERVSAEVEDAEEEIEEDDGAENLPDNYRPALAIDVPEGRACGNCFFYNEERINEAGDKAWCERWDAFVDGAYYCNAWQEGEEERAEPDALEVGDSVSWNSSGGRARGIIERIERDGRINIPNSDFTVIGTEDDPAALIRVFREGEDGPEPTDTLVGHRFSTLTKINALQRAKHYDDEEEKEKRDVNLTPPAYMRAAARRGLEYHAEGLSGDGLTERTVREARAMAAGNVTADKWVRIAAWIARHMGDLDSPDANPTAENYPSAGVVAHLLWGSGPSKSSARRAMEYAQGVVGRLEEENRASISQESEQMAKIEKRTNEVKFELRAVEDGDGMTFTGYAAVFNSPSEPLPFIERIAPGAFKRSLKARNDIKLLWNHDTGAVLGSTRAGTLKLEEDSYGLRVTAVLPDTNLGRDVRTLVQRGDVNAMSFGFSVPAGGDTWNAEGTERTLKSVRIFEVSVVAYPAYQQTAGTATVRSYDAVAKRAEVDADKLADAFLAIEDGKDLSLEQSELLTTVIQRLTPQEKAEVEDNSDELTALALKKMKLDLMLKKV